MRSVIGMRTVTVIIRDFALSERLGWMNMTLKV